MSCGHDEGHAARRWPRDLPEDDGNDGFLELIGEAQLPITVLWHDVLGRDAAHETPVTNQHGRMENNNDDDDTDLLSSFSNGKVFIPQHIAANGRIACLIYRYLV